MTTDNAYKILDDCADLMEKYSSTFPKPADMIGKSKHTAIITLWLAMKHGLRIIHSMSHLLQEDDNNAVLSCILLRSYYELSIRLLWASRETDGWLRLYASDIQQKKKWAAEAKLSQNPDMVKIANDELQWIKNIENQRDSHGKPIESVPKNDEILKYIDQHEKKYNPLSSQGNSGQLHYTFLYRTLCRASHANIEALTGEVNKMYISQAYIGGMVATVNLLTAFMHTTSQSPYDDIKNMLTKDFMPICERCRQL
ncbi:MAG: DUF5677 domain-containing protein [Thermoguttaceae bacterium]|jgi:hypothetical protein